MGLCGSAPTGGGARGTARKGVKILVLGTGESGKSTFLKQMRILHGEGFSEEDRIGFRGIIWGNVVDAMKTMLDAMDSLKIPIGDNSLTDDSYQVLDIDTKKPFDIVPYADSLAKLWADSGVQAVFARSNEYQLSSSTKYYLSQVKHLCQADYVPTEQDVLRARRATTDIHEYTIEVTQGKQVIPFFFRDVGGQRSERAKWVHCFEVGCVLLLVVLMCAEYYCHHFRCSGK